MIHIFKYEKGSNKGKYGFAESRKGRHLFSDHNEEYHNKKAIFKVLQTTLSEIILRGAVLQINIGKSVKWIAFEIQDNTYKENPVVIRLWNTGEIETTDIKPSKPYKPNEK
jgi:hypothetical protein